jgi:hypothetical protein
MLTHELRQVAAVLTAAEAGLAGGPRQLTPAELREQVRIRLHGVQNTLGRGTSR